MSTIIRVTPTPGSGGSGAVSSVNGRIGDVVGLAESTDGRFPTSGEKTKLTAMPSFLLINTTGDLPAGTAAGTVVVVKT